MIIDAESKEAIIAALIGRELNDIKYKSVSDWFAYLTNLVSTCKIPEKTIAKIGEVKATRDILVHNAGVVNQTYLNKSGQFSRAAVGEYISITADYTLECWQLLSSTLIEILDLLIGVYNKDEE
ncbi:MAG: hypothetical protein SVY15_05305 [Halobacteriota archaeon]|nr:hypothetical protein [Halobacteriota archaeon]